MPFRLQVVAPLLAALFALAGCNVVAVGYQDPGAKTEALAAFHAGEASFACGQGLQCAVRWGASRSAASRLLQAERWDDVADVVLAAGYEQDLSWFYLGVAAEGLGQTRAARIYYDNAVRRSLYGAGYACTAAGMMTCDGVRLPDDAQRLVAGLDARNRTPSRRTAAANPAARLGTGQAGAQATGSGEGARAYVQNLARIRAEDETRRGITETGPRQTAQAGITQVGGCPTNFRC